MNSKRFFGTLRRCFCFIALIAMFGFAVTSCPDDITFNIPEEPKPFANMTAVEVVADIKLGWNLGNTLDADGGETAWGNPRTKESNFIALKNAGFNAVRIPVSWHNGVNGSYNISASWMSRVVDVVNYAIDNDMYVILNSHHDNSIFRLLNSNAAEGQAAFKRIWEQIADTFKNYDEKLIFEALNEPRTEGGTNEWNGGTAEDRGNLNKYYQIFVDTVRASGGNNDKRMLLINTYAASNTQNAMNGLVLPTDTGPNKLIVSFHQYSPNEFALYADNPRNTWDINNAQDKSAITAAIDRYYTKFVGAGTPVLIGEFGAMNKDNEATREIWAEFYVGYAKSKEMPCFWWDNGVFTGTGEKFGLLNRNSNSFTYPKVLAGLQRGAGITP